ncbi:MAG: aminopeptidase P family N-terminal domain-containing protein, partial [Lachnospiraceae bacterium]|nr:aminopeptidase P family N-terminal domain-containing protein [Lachnospiraceae bacterium]
MQKGLKMDDSRLVALRRRMQKKHIDLYMIFLADYHGSETVVEAFGEIEWLSGFSGTNAVIVVSQEEAGLWTDGRYFIQAERQIRGSGVRLFPMGEEGVPTVEEYLKKHLPRHGRIGLDGRVISYDRFLKYQKIAEQKKGRIINGNLLDRLWPERPKLPKQPVWILEKRYAGISAEKKLSRVYDEVKKHGADGFLLSHLYDIAWLLNLRGSDIRHVPVPLCFFYMTERRRTLYIAKEALDRTVRRYLKKHDIRIRDYEKVFSDLKKPKAKRVLIDSDIVSASLVWAFPEKTRLVFGKNPTVDLKAKKNRAEIRNTIEAHIKDGVAVTRFIHYIKTHIGREPLSECRAAAILHELRAREEHFLDESFDTISAYGANAAMMHYEPNEAADIPLAPKGFLLVDSGGHYLEGTTDITRTICLGEVSEEERHGYTLALRGALALMAARFPQGVYCQNLDVLARGPFWAEGLDYRCGTGHGVGHILNVHEDPNGFRWKITRDYPACELVPGMITTDEPGLYEEDRFGRRL